MLQQVYEEFEYFLEKQTKKGLVGWVTMYISKHCKENVILYSNLQSFNILTCNYNLFCVFVCNRNTE